MFPSETPTRNNKEIKFKIEKRMSENNTTFGIADA